MGRAVRIALASYPMWWKERYGAETSDLTEDLLADDDARHVRVFLNLAVGSVLAWVHYRRPDRRPRFAGTPWGPVPDGGHRDVFGNRGLSPRSLEELDPDETVLGVIDGWRGSPFLAAYPLTMALLILVSLLVGLVLRHGAPRFDSVQILTWSALLAVTLAAKVLTSSATVAIAVTSNGLVVFRMRTFTRCSGSIVLRLPAAPPTVVRTGTYKIKVDLGGTTFWVVEKSLPLIRWMASAPAGAPDRPTAA